MQHLLPLLDRLTDTDGLAPTAIPFLSVNRRSRATPPHAHVLQPCVAVFVAGHKRVRIGRRDVHLESGDSFVLAQATNVTSHIVRAPYFCVMLAVDVELIADLMAFPLARSPDVTDPLARLIRLLDAPSEIEALAPLYHREIFYRLLAGPSGDGLRDFTRDHDPVVAATRAWIDRHYAEPFSAERLAAHAHLSVSALYARFKARTQLTPLQYQKRCRIHVARRLLLAGDLDVSAAAHRVGYASAAQFSRDYRRELGAPPRRDVEALRRVRSPASARTLR